MTKESEMEYHDIERLAVAYANALANEYEAKLHLEQLRAKTKDLEGTTLAAAYAEGVIDGKNADTRKRQEADVLASDGDYQEALFAVIEVERRVNVATVDAEHNRALVGLTKAWLYSQAGM